MGKETNRVVAVKGKGSSSLFGAVEDRAVESETLFNAFLSKFSGDSVLSAKEFSDFYSGVILPFENMANIDPQGTTLRSLPLSRRFVAEFLFFLLCLANARGAQDERCRDSWYFANKVLYQYDELKIFSSHRAGWGGSFTSALFTRLGLMIHPTLLQSMVRGFINLLLFRARSLPTSDDPIPDYMLRFESVVQLLCSEGQSLRFL